MRIKYVFDDTDVAMGFPDAASLEGVDFQASIEKYTLMVARSIALDYPLASIEVYADSMQPSEISIDGEDNGWLENIVAGVWQSFEWVVVEGAE